ncbi:MAG: hypothetical protein KC910_17340 [Candidatus Eremiobacteraeota bacterium]|nr:hypothetical protein [Candidatus Eremiobacteraeota bacterium]
MRARRFVLEDDEGGVRAQLQSAGNGAVAMTFHDTAGKLGALIGLDPKQAPTLALLHDGKMKASLDLDKESGQPSLTLQGPADSKVTVGFNGQHQAGVDIHDQAGRLRLRISVAPDGATEVALYDNKGYVRESLKRA